MLDGGGRPSLRGSTKPRGNRAGSPDGAGAHRPGTPSGGAGGQAHLPVARITAGASPGPFSAAGMRYGAGGSGHALPEPRSDGRGAGPAAGGHPRNGGTARGAATRPGA